MTYCLKHIWLWNKWMHLKNSYKDVDYSYCIEHEDNTKLMQEVACAGGACQIF